MNNRKIIKLDNNIWISKEDWDNCKKFEEEQHKKLIEFIYSNKVNSKEDSNASTTE